jgi:hypothetical protein
MPEANWWDAEPKWERPAGAPSWSGGTSAAQAAPVDTVEHGGRPVAVIHPKNWWDAEPKWERPEGPSRNISGGEAVGRGVIDSATFGLAPAIAGAAAAGTTGEQMPISMGGEFPGLETVATGAERLTRGVPEAQAAAEPVRQEMKQAQEEAFKQHPYLTTTGELLGSVVTPGFGAAAPVKAIPSVVKLAPKAAPAVSRAISGGIAGAVGGGLYGVGTGISADETPGEIIGSGLKGAAEGAPLGGVLKAGLGPRAPAAASTRGQRAAQTAAELVPGGGLPRGFASDSPTVQGTTAKLQSMPILGERIHGKVDKVSEAAGERIGHVAKEMGSTGNRAEAETVVKSGLESVIDRNRDTIKEGYAPIDAVINPDQHYTMPRLDAVLDRIMKARAAAGWEDPAAGLGQFRNVAAGATFQGARDARSDAYRGGSLGKQHPTYDKRQFDAIRKAMTEDMREMVAHAGGGQAVAQFDKVEKQFGRLAEQNNILNDLINAKGQKTIDQLLRSAKEKSGGNVQLLAQLRQSMTPQEFEPIGGTLLSEMMGRKGEFSLTNFSNSWNDLSKGAKGALFDPAHVRDIDSIAEMASHIKVGMRQSNNSHTASVLVLLEIMPHVVGTGVDLLSTGTLGHGEMAGAAISAGLAGLTYALGSPSKAASMRAFANAYSGMLEHPTPARIASFKVATRNLANTLDVPVEKIMSAASSRGQEFMDQSEQQPTEKK